MAEKMGGDSRDTDRVPGPSPTANEWQGAEGANPGPWETPSTSRACLLALTTA